MSEISKDKALAWAKKVAASKPPRYTDDSRNAAAYILEAALSVFPAIGEGSRVEVKALEWGETSYGSPEAYSVVGVYRLNRAGGGGWSVSIKSEVLHDSDGRTNFATVEAAKAAAQADYEQRVLSALRSPPEPVRDAPEPVKELVPTQRLDQLIGSGDPSSAEIHDMAVELILRRRASPPDGELVRKAEAFDQIVAVRKRFVEATAAYNARLEFVKAERARGNWSIKLDREYEAVSEAQAAYYRTVQELSDRAVLSAKEADRG